MERLFTINNKNIFDTDTTILFTSSSNYQEDMIGFINQNCEVITDNYHSNLRDIPDYILGEFNLLELKKKEKLTKIDEITINILYSLVSNKKVVVFFNILTYVNNEFKEKLIKILKKQGKRIINYTSEIEETLYLDYLFVIHQDKVIMEGKTKEVLKEEKILKKLGFNLPFIVELSCGLKYYNIIDKIYYDCESLVNALWK